uniref:Uncharacterized protein n=1 Tax=Arundo donax TaxID=35708 RepID=A0A0A9DJ84_ARUDO
MRKLIKLRLLDCPNCFLSIFSLANLLFPLNGGGCNCGLDVSLWSCLLNECENFCGLNFGPLQAMHVVKFWDKINVSKFDSIVFFIYKYFFYSLQFFAFVEHERIL